MSNTTYFPYIPILGHETLSKEEDKPSVQEKDRACTEKKK